MTYTQYINCNKWKKIIGISLWSGATLGLIIGLYFGYDHAVNGEHPDCSIMLPDIWYKQCMTITVKDPFGLQISLIANIGNYIGIWIIANRHYKWIELKCGIKPKLEKVE